MFFQGGLIPVYLNLKMLGLLDTFFVFIFPTLFNFFYVVILMSFFNGIPDSVEDSAFIDGAGYFTIYRKIYMPMSVPVIVTIFLFVGVWHWETWFDSLYYTRKESLQTFAAFLMKIVKRFSALDVDLTDLDEESVIKMANLQGTRFSTMIISIFPVLMIYPFIQKYFVKGIRLGSIKG
jgi:putative aldouronate transport system permease protein